MTYDLEERTALFGKNIIIFCKSLKKDIVAQPLIVQLVRSGTSIGANYTEANGASSKKDFRNKIFICKKEAHETRYWLKMILNYLDKEDALASKLQKECQELILIFQKIISSLDKNK